MLSGKYRIVYLLEHTRSDICYLSSLCLKSVANINFIALPQSEKFWLVTQSYRDIYPST